MTDEGWEGCMNPCWPKDSNSFEDSLVPPSAARHQKMTEMPTENLQGEWKSERWMINKIREHNQINIEWI